MIKLISIKKHGELKMFKKSKPYRKMDEKITKFDDN